MAETVRGEVNDMSGFDPIKMNADDPRLTAFALDELEGEEQARVAAAVAADPLLQVAVDEIRAAAGQLAVALKSEPLPAPVRPVHLEPYRTVRPARMFRFPYWAVAGLAAAACFALILAKWEGPLFERAGVRDAQKLAEAAQERQKAVDGNAALRQQASNQIDIQFPKQETGDGARSSSEASGFPEGVGVVVPNPPSDAAGLSHSAEPRSAIAAAGFSEGSGARGDSEAVARNGAIGAADRRGDSDFIAAAENPRSTFPVAVDTTSYANVRRFLLGGRRPPRDAVRVEGLVNYFNYDYAAPKPVDKDPFAGSLEAASAPWEKSHRLVRIGLKARELPDENRPDRPGRDPAIVAREVSVQVEFNPARVQAYRLIGYEAGGRGTENAGGDTFNAGDVSAGHAVTALYEVVPAGVEWKPESADGELKYRRTEAGGRRQEAGGQKSDNGVIAAELLTVRVRYKAPDTGAAGSIEFPLIDRGTAFADASSDFRFAAAVAGFGMVLRDSPHTARTRLSDVLQWARQAIGPDADRSRGDFISLVKRAEEILPAQG
jgi:hypothetical protein